MCAKDCLLPSPCPSLPLYTQSHIIYYSEESLFILHLWILICLLVNLIFQHLNVALFISLFLFVTKLKYFPSLRVMFFSLWYLQIAFIIYFFISFFFLFLFLNLSSICYFCFIVPSFLIASFHLNFLSSCLLPLLQPFNSHSLFNSCYACRYVFVDIKRLSI